METIKIQILGDPRTKKNSQQIFRHGSRPSISPSKAFNRYHDEFLWQVPKAAKIGICSRVNVCCLYYMQTHRDVDLLNLLEGTMDLLKEAGVIVDDKAKIVAAHDGSRVRYDKDNPRVEIVIESMRE